MGNSIEVDHIAVDHRGMIITHTQNLTGQRRVYLGGKSSLECWIEPSMDGRGWTFHVEEAVASTPLSAAAKKAIAVHTLTALADALELSPHDLQDAPFEMIAALHTADPYASRRVASGRRRNIDNGYVASTPGMTRPRVYSPSHDSGGARRRS